MKNQITAIILAAGKGTRLKAPPTKNKVVYELANKPIISYAYDMLQQVGIEDIICVVGYASDSVRQALGNKVTYATQESPLGTGHAVKTALPYVTQNCQIVLSMYGDDSAFYPAKLIKTLLSEHVSHHAAVTLVTVNKLDPSGLGRILRDQDNEITAIVEEKNATAEQKAITEINTGLYCFDRTFIQAAVSALTPNSVTGEYYLTDVIAYAVAHGNKVHSLRWPSDEIWCGVNTPEQLQEAHNRMLTKNCSS